MALNEASEILCDVHYKNLRVSDYNEDGSYLVSFEPGDMILMEYLCEVRENDKVKEVFLNTDGRVHVEIWW